MLFLLLFTLFPQYPSEITYMILDKDIKIKVFSESEKFRIDIIGKKTESYYKEKNTLMLLQDDKWKEIKKPIYNENNFFLSIFFEKDENFQIEIEKDSDGLAGGTIISKKWGKALIKRIEIKKFSEIPEKTFPNKPKLSSKLSKLKSFLKSDDEKEVSATTGARGVGEEENLDAQPNYEALKEVESVSISKEEIEKFAKEGGLK